MLDVWKVLWMLVLSHFFYIGLFGGVLCDKINTEATAQIIPYIHKNTKEATPRETMNVMK